MSTDLFTIVCEYEGGTYISQHSGQNEIEACRHWIIDFGKRAPIPRCSDLVVEAVETDFEREDFPVALNGLKNVWCASTSADNKYLGITIIKTCAA